MITDTEFFALLLAAIPVISTIIALNYESISEKFNIPIVDVEFYNLIFMLFGVVIIGALLFCTLI